MPTFIKTVCFSTGGKFNPKKDDPEVNAALTQLQNRGAKIIDVKLSLAGTGTAVSMLTVASYLITYESPTPID